MASPLILSLSTVFALIGIVLVAIAFGTNNWQEYKLDRAKILSQSSTNASIRMRLTAASNSADPDRDIYFDRVFGLFRECFPSQVPSGFDSYVEPLGGTCINIRDYQIPENRAEIEAMTEPEKTRMHLMRTTVAFYIVGLAFLFVCLMAGISGCWRRSPSLILTTGILLLFATLFLAAAMAVWHGVDYLQREVIDGRKKFYKSWDPLLKQYTDISYGWSYMISWIGISFILLSSILMLGAYRAMKEEERDEFEKKRAPYMMTNYYDQKSAMVSPYGYATYGYAYPGYNYANYAGAGAAQAGNGYYGYLTYGR